MLHYICNGGCKSVVVQDYGCPIESCAKFEEPLLHCECENDHHYGKQNRADQGDEIISPTGDPPPFPQAEELTSDPDASPL